METELPLELLLTHTRAEVEAAVAGVTGEALVFSGRHWRLPVATDRDTFLAMRDRWARSLNCWEFLKRNLSCDRLDAIYLAGYADGRVGFLSPEFQALMLEIWKVKFLRLPRLGEVIRSTAGRRLDHFLNDGDSPDIPVPVYVGYLNRIRDMAMEIRP